MKTVIIRSDRDIWFMNSFTGRTELLKAGVHTKVGEMDYISLHNMFGKEITLIEEVVLKEEPKVQEVKIEEPIVEETKVPTKTSRKKKSK